MDLETRQAIGKLAEQLIDLQARVGTAERGAATPQLPNSSITGGGIKAIDEDGTHRGTVGFQNDGTFAVVAANGAPPPAPSTPVLTPGQLSLTVAWDGLFATDDDGDPSTMPLDFDHVQVHLSETSGFTPDATTLQGSLAKPGALVCQPLVDSTTFYAVLVGVNTSGVLGDASAAASGVPEAVVASDVLDGIITTVKLANDAVTNAKIADTAVDANKLQDGSVSAQKILDDAITATKIATGAVTSDALGPAAVTTAAIADAAITADQLGAAAVTTAKIATAAITAALLSDDAVTAGKLADGSIDASTLFASGVVGTSAIQASAITSALIAADTIVAGNISAGAIGTTQLAANAVTAGKIAANTITAAQIQAATITATEIAGDTITAAQVAAGAINTSELAANAVTAAKIAANTITASLIAAGTITANEIASHTITATLISAGAIGATELAANSVIAGKIAAGVVDATALAAGSVTTAKLDALAVTAANIAANAVTAGKVAAGAITASTIAAGAIDGKTITGATVITNSATGGIFVYSGTPAAGNMIVSIAAQAGTDAFGNTYPQGMSSTAGNLGGTLNVSSNGIYFYVPNAGTGNLRTSIANADGTDPYGNTYKAGLFLNQRQGWFTGNNNHTVVINPTGQAGPQIIFFPSGTLNFMEIVGDLANNRLLIQTTGGSGTKLEVNAPMVATGGYTGSCTFQGAEVTYPVSSGAFTDYSSVQWNPPTLVCPPSETVDLTIWFQGHPSTVSANQTITLAAKIKQGATVLYAPTLTTSGVMYSNDGVAATTNDVLSAATFTVGRDILAGRSGQTITFVPTVRISSTATPSAHIAKASMSVKPSLWSQATSSFI